MSEKFPIPEKPASESIEEPKIEEYHNESIPVTPYLKVEAEHLEAVRANLAEINPVIASTTNQPVSDPKNITGASSAKYIVSHLPSYLGGQIPKGSSAERMTAGVVKATFELLASPILRPLTRRLLVKEVVGKEKIPDGPVIYVLVSHNHGQGEPWQLLGALLEKQKQLHILSSTTLNWQKPLERAGQMGLGFLPVTESIDPAIFERVAEHDQEGKLQINQAELTKYLDLLSQKDPAARAGYEKVIRDQVELGSGRGNLLTKLEEMNAIVAALLQGDSIAVATQGLFSYEEKEGERQDFAGFALIAKQYKRMATKMNLNQPLNIVPVYAKDKRVVFGDPLNISENEGREAYLQELEGARESLRSQNSPDLGAIE